MRIVLKIIFCGLLLSCSSIKMKVSSSPEGADIILVTEKGRKKIATTPAELSRAELGRYSNYHLLISKTGYAPQSFLFESRRVPSRGRLYAELNKATEAVEGDQSLHIQREVDKVARKVAIIQSALLKRDYGQAEVFAKELLTERPKLGVGWSLLANTYYLQQRGNEALTAYEKALEYDSENRETLMMIRKIKSRGLANE